MIAIDTSKHTLNIINNITEYFKCLGGQTFDLQGYQGQFNDNGMVVANAVFKSPADFKLEDYHKIVDKFQQYGKPFGWWLYDDLENVPLETQLIKDKFTMSESFTGMALTLDNLQWQNSDCEIRQITKHELGSWCNIMKQCFSLSEHSTQHMASQLLQRFDNPNLRHYAAINNGELIGTGTLLIHGATAGLYNGAVLPKYRNQGIGTALKLHRLAIAKEVNMRTAVIHSSLAGQSIDKKIGFKPMINMRLFSQN